MIFQCSLLFVVSIVFGRGYAPFEHKESSPALDIMGILDHLRNAESVPDVKPIIKDNKGHKWTMYKRDQKLYKF